MHHALELRRAPQNGPIYYVWLNTLDHTENGENKTAGKKLANFQKSRVWSTPRG